MPFMKDWLDFNGGNECPRNYHIWSSLCMMSAVVSRKCWLPLADPELNLKSYITIQPNIYACLVGAQGNGKTIAKDLAYDCLKEACPDLPTSAESMSKEAITQFMAKDEQRRAYTDPVTKLVTEYRPFSIWCTELKYFLSINPLTMLDFLTAIYDRKFLDVITKNKGTDIIVNPSVTILACETPNWIRDRLKQNVISGGFARRMIMVNEIEDRTIIPFPCMTMEAATAYARCREHLKRVFSVVGEFSWTIDAARFYKKWYVEHRKHPPEDPVMQGWHRSKHIQALKVCMLLALGEEDIQLKIREDLLALSIELLDRIEPNMTKLFDGSGVNKFAEPGLRLVELVIQAGGIMEKMKLKGIVYRDLMGQDFDSVVRHFLDVGELFQGSCKLNGSSIERVYLMTQEGKEKLKQQGNIK